MAYIHLLTLLSVSSLLCQSILCPCFTMDVCSSGKAIGLLLPVKAYTYISRIRIQCAASHAAWRMLEGGS